MKSRGGNQHNMQSVFVFVLLGLFAVLSTLLVLLGAQMYRETVDLANANNELRVLTNYVRGMVRAEDALQGVQVEDLDGVRVLSLYEDIDGERYATWIYAYDGQLREQFSSVEFGFDPEFGDVVCPVGRFEPSVSGSLLSIDMTTAAGEPCGVQMALRCA